MPDWLELELAHGLAPAEAPEGLWDRIEGSISVRPASRREVPGWAIAAMVMLALSAATWLAVNRHAPVPDLEALAREELQDPTPLDFCSSNPVEISGWMRQHAGVIVPLPATNGVRLSGARVIRRGGARIASVDYSVGGHRATLLVARAGSAPDMSHGRLSWRLGGQVYGLACANPADPRAGCLLCHASL